MSSNPMPPEWVLRNLRDGIAIPAHPLALTPDRKLDERRQRALTRYYHAAGAGGIAVGVHTTQFEIRDPQYSLLKPVLQLATTTANDCDTKSGRPTIRIAGVCGPTKQAVSEAALARELGYHAGLLSLSALKHASDAELINHCQTVAREIALVGFYLQPAVGGRVLSRTFWRRFAEVENVIAIKIAPFNRYQTLDVLHGVLESGRTAEIALYTGNDDNIVVDLLTEFAFAPDKKLRIVGGLLGHWACWTKRAVELLEKIKTHRTSPTVPAELLTVAMQVTDMNAALFDAANGFAGCIPGIHEILRRQGLLEGTRCLNPHEVLSPAQAGELDRVGRTYPHLTDDEFVAEHRDQWLSS